MSVERALLLVQSKAGTGRYAILAESLRSRLAGALPSCSEVALAITGDHAEVRERTTSFLRESSGSTALLVGGGSGTLRAAVEAACTLADGGRLPGRERVRIAPLRMGSGNLLAKRLGYPKDAAPGRGPVSADVTKGGLWQPMTGSAAGVPNSPFSSQTTMK